MAGLALRSGLAAWVALVLVACVGPRPADAATADSSSPALRPAAGPTPLIVASDLDNPPFAEVSDSGRETGRDVEMMEAVAAALGRPLEWKRIPFETLMPAAQAGLVDVVCATLGITAERGALVSFSRPYFETVITVVVRSGPGEPRGWDDLNGRPVAAGAGTTSEAAVRRHLERARLVTENKSGASSPERLLLGEVDGIAMDGPAAEALVAASGGALTTIHTPLAAERYALALPLGRPELLASINAALADLERSGQMARWNGKYGLRSTARPDKR